MECAQKQTAQNIWTDFAIAKIMRTPEAANIRLTFYCLSRPQAWKPVEKKNWATIDNGSIKGPHRRIDSERL